MLRKVSAAMAIGLGLLCVLCLPASSHAQSVYGGIYGNVTDNTGAAIPNATVTVTDEAKGTIVVVQSNAAGEYEADNLTPDNYTVKVAYQGFETFEAKRVPVFAAGRPKIDAQLVVGGQSTTVEVNADTIPVLQTAHADVATVFDAKTVQEIPTAGQNFTNLQLLLPGAQKLGWAHAASENPQASQQIQVDGQAFGGVAFELDGTDNQDPILGIIVINPNLDAIGETKITTQNFDAEFGKAVSSIVTAQTKSGSNSFHGSAYDYRQSNANLARNPYTQFPTVTHPGTSGLVPGGLKNQFGGSIGGPVFKNKLFFFGDYQGQRQNVGISQTNTVPTKLLTSTCLGQTVGPSGIPGCDFSEYENISGTGTGLIYRPDGTPYPGNVVPTALVSPQATAFFALLQPYAPNTGGNFGNGLAGNRADSGNGGFNSNQWDERVDYTLSDKITLFERFSRFTDTLTGKPQFGAAGGPGFGLAGYAGTSQGANDSLASGADFVISPTLVTDVRVGYYRYNIQTVKYDQTSEFANELGIPGLNLGSFVTSGAPRFQLDMPGSNGLYGSGLGVNSCNCPLTEKESQLQVVNNWTKILKTHTIKFGADLRFAHNLRVPSDSNRTGQLEFYTGTTSNPKETVPGGLGLATFALGETNYFQRYVSVSTTARESQDRLYFYAEDSWRVTPKLTANIGLRYEIYTPESVNAKGNGALMNYVNGTSDGYLRVAGYGNIGNNLNWSKSSYPYNPRVGVTYQLDPKTVIRAGYGRSFDIGVFGSIFGHVVTQNLPVLAVQTINTTTTTASGAQGYAFCLGGDIPGGCTQPDGQPSGGGPVGALNNPNVFPSVPSNGLLPAPGYAVSPKARPNSLRLPTVDAWNASVQHAITPTLTITIAYVGNKGTHTLSAGDGNNTNPNETALTLPAQYSVVGAPLHWKPGVDSKAIYSLAFPQFQGIDPDGGTSNAKYLQRYYGGTLTACQDPVYTTTAPAGTAPNPGACGWTNGISYYGDDQDSHFNALQITLAKQFTKGLSFNANYAWQQGIDFNNSYATWSRQAVRGRNNDIRPQSFVGYGVYQLPFGRNQQFASGVPTWVNEIIGDWQLSPVVTWASGLPFTLSYNSCNNSVGGTSAPCYVNGRAGNLAKHLTAFNPVTHTRSFYNPVVLGQGGLSAPGLDMIGTAGRNSAYGPHYFNTDLTLQKNFPIKESLFFQFRVDAFDVFNHITAGNPGGNVETAGTISGEGQGAPGPRQLQFSMRVQF